jgi:guanosine-diphosphatase
MFDAGSTGSRIHVFEFIFDNGNIKLVREVYEHLKPGLSAYADDPDGAAKSLVPLLDIALREVPEDKRQCTPMLLKATAGLRLIGADKSDRILSRVRALFARYPFKVPSHGVEVMDGVDEGPFAWLTVNFLLGKFTTKEKSPTAGIMDLGGGSTQIVFEPDSDTTLEKAPTEYTRKISLFGRLYHIYQHSYLGYGLKEAGKRIRRVLGKAHTSEGKTQEVPCFSEDHEETFEERLLRGRKGSSFDQCFPHVNAALEKDATCPANPCSFRGVYQPPLTTFTGDWYAFSYFYDLALPHMESTKNDVLSVLEFKQLAEKACTIGSPENKGSNCLEMSFLYSLLAKGYSLPDGAKLNIKKKINGIETAWALGAMITEM